jgi:hypothetical protein
MHPVRYSELLTPRPGTYIRLLRRAHFLTWHNSAQSLIAGHLNPLQRYSTLLFYYAMPRYGSYTVRHIAVGMTRDSPYDLIAQCVLELRHETEQHYASYIEEPDQDSQEVIIMVVKNENSSCFHMAITGTNTDIENAKAVCSQAVLYRSTDGDPDLYYAVVDSVPQTVSSCLCSPSKQEYEDLTCLSMHREAGKVAQRLKTYIISNAEVLHG